MTISILNGDCREMLKTLPSGSVNCCVTSPPYFGLRDYGVDGQIGLEHRPDQFVQQLVDVFKEVRRVLRDDGTLWLNLGDTYAQHKGGTTPPAQTVAGGVNGKGGVRERRGQKDGYNPSRDPSAHGLKHKELMGIPWRVAFALQADGWYLRQDIIWNKPNPMPESVTDRCTKAHEYIFLLTKNERYFFDAESIKEDAVKGSAGSSFNKGKTGVHQQGRSSAKERVEDGKRNRRSVWSVATKPFKGAHFATFPPELIEPCILAGCPEGGTVLDPFFGAGTTGLVAQRNARQAIGIELNSNYVSLAKQRLGIPAFDFSDVLG